jgi:hypothetical protein
VFDDDITVLHGVYSFRDCGNHLDNLLFIVLRVKLYRLKGWLPFLSIVRKQYPFEEIIFEERRRVVE